MTNPHLGGEVGGRHFLPEPVDENLGTRVLHGEDVAQGTSKTGLQRQSREWYTGRMP